MNSGDRIGNVTVRRCFHLFVVAIVFLFVQSAIAATIAPRPLTKPHKRAVKENPRARHHMRNLARSRRVRSRTVATLKRHHYYERFYTSSYSRDITDGDVTTGEDPVVRQAAIDALAQAETATLTGRVGTVQERDTERMALRLLLEHGDLHPEVSVQLRTRVPYERLLRSAPALRDRRRLPRVRGL